MSSRNLIIIGAAVLVLLLVVFLFTGSPPEPGMEPAMQEPAPGGEAPAMDADPMPGADPAPAQ